MITDVDRAKYMPPPTPPKKKSVIEWADSVVDIRDILKDMGIWTPSGDYYSYKIWCPWHYEHADQNDKNCRIFSRTNIYCFAMHGYISSTYLYSRWKGITREKAAKILLDERGLLHKPWRETWNELVDLREKERSLGSKQDFVSALNVALATYPEYMRNEYSPEMRLAWRNILHIIDRAWEIDLELEQLNKLYEEILQRVLDHARIIDR